MVAPYGWAIPDNIPVSCEAIMMTYNSLFQLTTYILQVTTWSYNLDFEREKLDLGDLSHENSVETLVN